MRRFLGVLLAVVAVVALVAVAGVLLLDDRIRAAASEEVAAQLQASVPFEDRPEVAIEGYPFAWHLLTGQFPGARVRGRAMPVQADAQTAIPLYDVDVTLTGVAYRPDAVRAASLAGGGRLDYADLSRLSGATITPAADSRLAFEKEVEVVGLRFPARLTGRPSLDRQAQTITLTDNELEVSGVRLPQQATDAVVAAVVAPFGVRLPYDLTLTSVTAAPEGLQVEVDATDVVFPLR